MYNLEIISPKSLKEALDLKSQYSDSLHLLAGGTDVFVGIRNERWNWGEKPQILNLSVLKDELSFINETPDTIEIGPLVTFSELIKNQVIKDHILSLLVSVSIIGSPQVKNQGTIVGNIINASPAADSLPILYARDASLELQNSKRMRIRTIEETLIGPGQVDIDADEIVTKIIVPKLPNYEGDYLTLRQRYALSINVVSLGVEMLYDKDEDIIEDIRLALGAVSPTVVRARKTENLLRNKKFTKDLLIQAERLIQSECKPIDDVRSDKEYRKAMTGVLLRRFMRKKLLK